jgi:hypothetical protein
MKNENSKTSIALLSSDLEELEAITRQAVEISGGSIGKVCTGRQKRALAVFAKLIAHNMTIMKLVGDFLENNRGEYLLDHFSVGALGRASIDAALMTMYISEPNIDLKSWDFRRQLLFLHDINNRSRFLKPIEKQGEEIDFFKNCDEVRTSIQNRINALGKELSLNQVKLSEYENGRHLFVDGVRGAAREAGWSVDGFEFNQSYLSAYVHSHPVSFFRIEDHDVSFSKGSDFQFNFCRYVMRTIAEYTDSVVSRMQKFSQPIVGDPNGQLD